MILDRIKEYIDYKGITIAAFERSIGMANASFGKCLKNKRAIGTDKLEKILTIYTDISSDWLLLGIGEMIKTNCTYINNTISDKTNTKNTLNPKDRIFPDINQNNDEIFLTLIQDKDRIIREQAEEIGRLRERIAQIEREKGEPVSDAVTSGVANAG